MTLDFSKLLVPEIAWPKPGDKLIAARSPQTDAQIAQRPEYRWRYMVEGYRIGADALVDRALGSYERDSLVYPIIFLYRQHIELSLKHFIATFGPRMNIEPDYRNHRLHPLWNKYLLICDKYEAPSEDDATRSAGAIVQEFGKIDPESFSHRYVLTTDGSPIELLTEFVDLEHLRGTMKGFSNYMAGANAFMGDILQTHLDYEADCRANFDYGDY